MGAIASQITSLAIVYSAFYSGVDQRKHQSSASLAFVWGIHRDRWIPRTKGQLRGKCFHLMTSSWSTDCSCASGNVMCADHSILPQGQPVGRMTSLLHGGHVRIGVNFMSWSNFCVLVWLSLPWKDVITLSDIFRICGHVMSDVITLWWSREPWYDFFSVLDKVFVLVGFCLSWCHFTPWCNQPNLGMIFRRFGYNFRFSDILFPLMSLDILVWLTASWYDFFSFC